MSRLAQAEAAKAAAWTRILTLLARWAPKHREDERSELVDDLMDVHPDPDGDDSAPLLDAIEGKTPE